MNELADAGSDLELWECEGRVILPLYFLIFVSYIYIYIYIYIIYFLVVFVFLFLCLCVFVFSFCGFAQGRLLFRVMKGSEGRVICSSLLSVFVFFLWLCLCLCGLRSFVSFIALCFSFILVFLFFFWFLGQASGLVFSFVQWVCARPGNAYEPTCAVEATSSLYIYNYP